jgi:hypothetical protein
MGLAQSGAFLLSLQGLFVLEDHVAVFDGVEDLAAELALDELGVFIAGNDTDSWVFAVDGSGSHWRTGKILPRSDRGVNGHFVNFALL